MDKLNTVKLPNLNSDALDEHPSAQKYLLMSPLFSVVDPHFFEDPDPGKMWIRIRPEYGTGTGSDLYNTKEDDLYIRIEVFTKSLYDFYVGYKCFLALLSVNNLINNR